MVALKLSGESAPIGPGGREQWGRAAFNSRQGTKAAPAWAAFSVSEERRTMSENIDYAARVQRGAALLDEKWPTWVQDIDLDTLDIASGRSCMSAQYYQHVTPEGDKVAPWDCWDEGRALFGLDEDQYEEHGFNAPRAAVIATLNRLWRYLITERRSAAQPPEASER